MKQQEENLTSDEKLLSMLCHLSLFFGGLVIPIVIYFIQKGKSRFVTFNALETIYFHILYIIVVFAAAFLMVIVVIIGAIASPSRNDMSPIAIIFIVIAGIFIFAVVIYFIVYAIIGAVKSYQGQIKKYPMVGNMAYRQVYGS